MQDFSGSWKCGFPFYFHNFISRKEKVEKNVCMCHIATEYRPTQSKYTSKLAAFIMHWLRNSFKMHETNLNNYTELVAFVHSPTYHSLETTIWLEHQ